MEQIYTGNKFKLYVQRGPTGYSLAIRENGKVEGSEGLHDKDSNIVLINEDVSILKIRRQDEPHLYLCFGQDGKLFGEENEDAEGTLFKECLDEDYSIFRSVCYPDWYIGIKKNGTIKPGHKTESDQKAVKFLKVPSKKLLI